MSSTDILPPPVLEAPQPPGGKWERERDAFLRQLPELLRTHHGQYVAIHDGRVTEVGSDLVEVALRAYAKHGYVPMYVDLATEHPLPPVRIPSPRITDQGTP